MRKSLVMLIVIAAAVALCGVAFAQVCGPAGCAPVCLKPGTIPVVPVPSKCYEPKIITPKPGRCDVVPCPPVKVSIPGQCYIPFPFPEMVKVPKCLPVYRNLCKGAVVGECCNGCLPPTKWAARWVTVEKVCDKVVMVPCKGFVDKPIAVPCDEPAVCNVTCLEKEVKVPICKEPLFKSVWVPGPPIKPIPCCK